MAVVLVLAGLATIAAPALPASPAGAAPAAPCQGAGTRVSVVVDYGTVSGNSSPSATCITITSTMNGAQFLAARAQALGTPAPTYASSGLLCSIDGYPAGGCGDRAGGNYLYWSYWNGQSGRWVYSSQGPASRRMTANSVEGWRFVRGAGGPSDPAPRVAPNRSAICPEPRPTPTQAPRPAPVATASPRPASPQPAALSPNPATPAANQPANGGGTAPAGAPAAGATGAPAAGSSGAATARPSAAPAAGQATAQPATSAKAATTTATGKASSTSKAPLRDAPQKPASTTSQQPTGGPTTLTDSDRPAGRMTNELAKGRVPAGSPEEPTSGPWLGLGLAVLAIGGAAVGARWLRRRRLG